MTQALTLGKGLTIGNGITFGAGTGGGGGGSLILSLRGTVPTSGTTILDQSGNQNDFNWYGTNPWTVVNNYYDFASGTYATSNGNTLFNALTNEITIFAWVQFAYGFPNDLAIIARNPSFALRVDGGGHRLNLVKYNIADQNINYTFNTSDWYHICAIQSASNVTYVINGNTEGTVSGGGQNFNTSGASVFVGADDYIETNAPMYTARLDVWNVAKSVSDAQAAWNSQKSAYGY